ncbi:lamin tail domain-containing protein [Frankia sp. Cas3]|uniref:lamin tail domain-containing protein n=1 Tax=Frankia sp. Cas3 TaxID=3073926 RepID=UPI002AD3DCBA|nr:lamin tail domain-containing protein [Frankia sp. Cas3]
MALPRPSPRGHSPLRRLLPPLLAATLIGGYTATVVVPALATSPDVVISEVYGGGGNSGAPYLNDFVELYNRGSAAVSLSGWSTQYAASSGTNYLVTALSGTIQPGSKYLVKLGSAGSQGVALPTPDATGTTNMSATAGKVALVTTTTALTCGSNCHATSSVKDFIGYGAANDYETSPAATLSNTTSATRSNPATDTDNNANDFAKVSPTPQNSQSGGGGGSCTGYTTRIRDIQGSAHISPLNGQAVSNVRGVVTAVKSTGFWFQDPCPDTSDATSEGVFVYTSSTPTVSVGQEIAVGGTVSEYRPSGATTANLTTTEITSPSVSVLGTRTVPAATVIGTGGRVPPTTVIDDDATGSVETSGTFDVATDGIDFYESLEGMRVQVNNPVAVGPGNSYNEIPVLGDDGANASVRTNRGGIVLRQTDGNPERLVIDDAILAGSVPTGVNVGDHFSGPAAGVLDYSFANFHLLLTSPITRVDSGLTPQSTTGPGTGQISVATFNVENLDPTDPQSKFDGLAGQIVTNLAAPGIISVEEIQDNDGATNSSVVAADQTWTKLINAISAAGGPTYTYQQINPVDDSDGGEPGGNIRVGLLYRTDIGLTFAAGTPGDSTTAESVSDSGNSADRVNLSYNPGRIDPTNTAFGTSRKPLVGKFSFNSKPLFVIANHWNSKGGDNPLFGRYQPPTLSSETQRSQQAAVVKSFVQSILAIDSQARIVVAGDLNDFTYSAPVQTLDTAGLTDLPATLSDAERYTYVYEGNSQVLDHILLSSSLTGASHSYNVVHVNSEFATQQSDHDPQVVRLTLP